MRWVSRSSVCWGCGVPARDAGGECSRGEVFSEVRANRRVGDYATSGNELFDFAADVGSVPPGASGGPPGQHDGHATVAIQLNHPPSPDRRRALRVAVAEVLQFVEPALP